MKPIFIAEIKTQSPFGYKSEHSFISLMNLAITYGDWISVHTNALWGGDYDALAFVRDMEVNKPILAKGIHGTDDDIQRALDHGANYVLVVDRIPHEKYFDKVLIEISHLSDFETVSKFYSKSPYSDLKFVHNTRELNSGLPKKRYTYPEYRENCKWLCQASGIRSLKDVNSDANAFIVGEHLVKVCNEVRAIRNAELNMKTVNNDKTDDPKAIALAKENGWWIVGHKNIECYWWNGKESRYIDWDEPLINQIPEKIS